MAKEYELEIVGQPTWYSNQPRTIKMSFCEPEGGANTETGILLLIAGYGGNSESRVYRKMRNQFADKYNLVTLQCDYLGCQFMKSSYKIPFGDYTVSALTREEAKALKEAPDKAKELLKGKVLYGQIDLQETDDDYNEMGLLQAMDNLMAVKVLMDIMRENGLAAPRDRIYIYGQSHGAYLAYLCNYLAPELFAGIVENSAYLLPTYFSYDREVTREGDLLTFCDIYHYRVRDDKEIDLQAYDLRILYSGWENHAAIVCFHGADDDMIPLQKKKNFLDQISHVNLQVISQNEVDGDIFGSSGHSLNADLLKVFEKGYKLLTEKITEMGTQWEETDEEKADVHFQEQQFATDLWEYRVNWKDDIPVLERSKKSHSTDVALMGDNETSLSGEKLISIIIPCYNVKEYIDRCVESLVKQTIGIEKLELIFVNDASTDGTLEHLTDWEKKYPENILVINCEENHKQGAARNTGLQYASAPYVGYVDSDDWVDPSMYEKMYEKVEQYHPDAVCVLFTRDEQDGTVRMRSGEKKNGNKYTEITNEDERREFFSQKLTSGVWSGIYRKELLLEENLQFPEDLRYEDNYWSAIRDLVIRSYYIINEHLYHYMINENSTIMEQNSLHHLDRLVIELMKVEEYKRRGVFEIYHDEIEFSFLKLYFINTIRILFVRFQEIPYDIIYSMQDNVKELFPEYEKNPYLEQLPQLQQELLKIVSVPLDKEKIDILANGYRKVLLENQ